MRNSVTQNRLSSAAGNMVRPQMESQLGVQRITAHLAPSASQLTQYLERPPAGLNPLVWNQARTDNPNESLFLPVALVGFGELKRRMQAQEIQVERQQERLQVTWLQSSSSSLSAEGFCDLREACRILLPPLTLTNGLARLILFNAMKPRYFS